MISTEPESPSQFDRSIRDAYLRDFGPAVVGYVAVVLVIAFGVDFDTAGWWKYLAALVPLIPALWGVRAIARHIGRVDEMQRERILAAMAIGFGVAMSGAITLGLLGAMTGLETTRWGAWLIYALGMGGWAVAGATVCARG